MQQKRLEVKLKRTTQHDASFVQTTRFLETFTILLISSNIGPIREQHPYQFHIYTVAKQTSKTFEELGEPTVNHTMQTSLMQCFHNTNSSLISQEMLILMCVLYTDSIPKEV